MVIIIVRVIWIVVFTGSRKASKEEQGRNCYDNDSEERHLVGHEGTGQVLELKSIVWWIERALFIRNSGVYIRKVLQWYYFRAKKLDLFTI